MLDIDNIEGLEIVDLDSLVKSGVPETLNVLEQINQEDKVVQGQPSTQDKKFFKELFAILEEESEPKGPQHVPKKDRVVRNMDTQFPQKVKEAEEVLESGEPTKTIAQIREEKYLKFLEDEKQNREASEKEQIKAVECVLKVMNRHLDVVKEHANDLKA